MSTPISGGGYTPQQVTEMSQVWEDLLGSNPSVNADISQLQQIQQSFPQGSQHYEQLQNIINQLTYGGGSEPSFQAADSEIAFEIYPQLPNQVPPTMANSINSIIQLLQGNPSYQQMDQAEDQINDLLSQVRLMPWSPQVSVISQKLGAALSSVIARDPPTAQASLQFILNTQNSG